MKRLFAISMTIAGFMLGIFAAMEYRERQEMAREYKAMREREAQELQKTYQFEALSLARETEANLRDLADAWRLNDKEGFADAWNATWFDLNRMVDTLRHVKTLPASDEEFIRKILSSEEAKFVFSFPESRKFVAESEDVRQFRGLLPLAPAYLQRLWAVVEEGLTAEPAPLPRTAAER